MEAERTVGLPMMQAQRTGFAVMGVRVTNGDRDSVGTVTAARSQQVSVDPHRATDSHPSALVRYLHEHCNASPSLREIPIQPGQHHSLYQLSNTSPY